MSDEARSARARARQAWPVVRGRLEDASGELLRDVPPARRVLPDYARAEAPGRVIRPGEPTVLGEPLAFLGRETLIANKRAAARPKDLADVLALEAPNDDEPSAR